MAKKRHPMKMTPIMALSMMALAAMVVPIISISNSSQKTAVSNAASIRNRDQYVNYVNLNDPNPTRPTPTPSQKPTSRYPSAY